MSLASPPLDASSNLLPVVTTKDVSGLSKMSPEGQNYTWMSTQLKRKSDLVQSLSAISQLWNLEQGFALSEP